MFLGVIEGVSLKRPQQGSAFRFFHPTFFGLLGPRGPRNSLWTLFATFGPKGPNDPCKGQGFSQFSEGFSEAVGECDPRRVPYQFPCLQWASLAYSVACDVVLCWPVSSPNQQRCCRLQGLISRDIFRVPKYPDAWKKQHEKCHCHTPFVVCVCVCVQAMGSSVCF